MDFEKALVYELQTITELEERIFPNMAEINTEPPFVVYISSGGEKIMTLTGPTDLTELTCEIHIICETYAQIRLLSGLVLNKIRSFFRREIGQEGLYIKSVSHTEPSEDIEPNLNYHRSHFDIRIRF